MLPESKKFQQLCEIGTHIALTQSIMAQRHCAIVFSRGEVISIGYNSFDRCKFSKKYTPGCHAEIDALRQLPKPKNRRRKKLEMIILHPSKEESHEHKPSRPCSVCLSFIIEWGIDRIYYICPDTNKWVSKRTRDITDSRYSSFVRNTKLTCFKY